MKFKFSNEKLILPFILIVSAFFRFFDLNWDQRQHLHPDERFLTLVGNAMKLPASLPQYLNPMTSTFNPANTGYKFYVYGTFPVVLNKILALIFGTDTYDNFTLQGRALSGIADLLIVFFVYKTLSLFEGKYKFDKNIKYLGVFFYGVSVLPIQLSHFFAVDTFLNLFMFVSFYTALRFYFAGKLKNLIASAIFLGLAIATKITAFFLLPLILFFLTYPFWKKRSIKNLGNAIKFVLLYGLISYLTLRLADPYLFQNANFLDPRISSLFIENLKTLTYWSSPSAWYPPGVQWLHKNSFFPVWNLALFGLGIPYFLLSIAGVITTLIKKKRTVLLSILIWLVFFFSYQALQSSKTMRYFLIFYPFLSLFAAVGLNVLNKKLNTPLKFLVIVLVIVWPLSFFSIYSRAHTRIAASEWIYKNIPDRSTILTEYWDDPLPLSLSRNYGKAFATVSLPVFDPDTPEKFRKINTELNNADYYVLSSNRTWGSIPNSPERYPLMSKFYSDLLMGKTSYKKVAEFTSYPSLNYLGIPLVISDDFAEEAFTVNDHPKVIIFKNTRKNL